MKTKMKEIGMMICVSYTIISVVGAVINELTGSHPGNLNSVFMFLFTVIAVGVLNLYKIFQRWSPLTIMVVQYLIALALVLSLVAGVSWITHQEANGYWDIVISFTIPYWIGAVLFYIGVIQETRKQNDMIQEIQRCAKKKKQMNQ